MDPISAAPPSNVTILDHPDLSERRRRAFHRAKAHSRLVAVLRRALPLLALVCVSLYFFKGDFALEYKDMKASVEAVKFSKDELKMINPRLEGHDEKTGSYLIIADEASQRTSTPHLIRLKNITAKLDHPQNGSINMRAPEGAFDTKSEVLDLVGAIDIKGDDGLAASLTEATIEIKQQLITSGKPVFIERLGSSIEAQGIKIEGLTKVMNFVGPVKVKLIKSPEQKQPGETK